MTPLYDKFVAWALEKYGKPSLMLNGDSGTHMVVTDDDLRAAAAEWRRRRRTQKLQAERGKPGRRVRIPADLKCENPYKCWNKAEYHVDGIRVCHTCSRRWKKNGSFEPVDSGHPKVLKGNCACGKPARKKGQCDNCYGKARYARLRKGE